MSLKNCREIKPYTVSSLLLAVYAVQVKKFGITRRERFFQFSIVLTAHRNFWQIGNYTPKATSERQ